MILGRHRRIFMIILTRGQEWNLIFDILQVSVLEKEYVIHGKI